MRNSNGQGDSQSKKSGGFKLSTPFIIAIVAGLGVLAFIVSKIFGGKGAWKQKAKETKAEGKLEKDKARADVIAAKAEIKEQKAEDKRDKGDRRNIRKWARACKRACRGQKRKKRKACKRACRVEKSRRMSLL
jgi:cell division protein FtsB